jgi:hypothetical protein
MAFVNFEIPGEARQIVFTDIEREIHLTDKYMPDGKKDSQVLFVEPLSSDEADQGNPKITAFNEVKRQMLTPQAEPQTALAAQGFVTKWREMAAAHTEKEKLANALLILLQEPKAG